MFIFFTQIFYMSKIINMSRILFPLTTDKIAKVAETITLTSARPLTRDKNRSSERTESLILKALLFLFHGVILFEGFY